MLLPLGSSDGAVQLSAVSLSLSLSLPLGTGSALLAAREDSIGGVSSWEVSVARSTRLLGFSTERTPSG